LPPHGDCAVGAPCVPIGNKDWSLFLKVILTAKRPCGTSVGGGLNVRRVPLGNNCPLPLAFQMLSTLLQIRKKSD
jgi:hypothetical protein